jgi:AcrR family transcriptional regulator
MELLSMARTPRGQETKERILEIALREFSARGFQAVTIEEIAAAAGVTRGAVYHWFTDKDDLGRELQHELYDRLTALSLRALDAEADTVSNMRRAFAVYVDALGGLDEARFFLRDAWTIPALDEGGRRDQDAAVAMMEGILSTAIARGEIVPLPAPALARVLIGAWDEATLYLLTTGDRVGAEAVVAHLVESLRTTTASRPRGKRRASDRTMKETAR